MPVDRGLRGGAEPRGALLAGAIAACIAGYTLVDKEGLRYPSVAAVRESSVLVVAALAARWLREPVGQGLLPGSALVVGGVAPVALS